MDQRSSQHAASHRPLRGLTKNARCCATKHGRRLECPPNSKRKTGSGTANVTKHHFCMRCGYGNIRVEKDERRSSNGHGRRRRLQRVRIDATRKGGRSRHEQGAREIGSVCHIQLRKSSSQSLCLTQHMTQPQKKIDYQPCWRCTCPRTMNLQ